MVKQSVLFIIICLLVFPISSVQAVAGNKFKVSLLQCIDGDTAKFSGVGTTRFLYVDTPESTRTIEPFGKEVATYTCTTLKATKTIQLQFDGNRYDKYNRTLAWVWVDGKLLQKMLIQKGYVEKFYDYGTYSYENELIILQSKAIAQKVGLWRNQTGAVSSSSNRSNTSKTGYRNCTELRMEYPNGVPEGHKAYKASMDRDKDGYACEK